MALRRITDATGAADPLASIKGRLEGYTNGDTDLAWSRITYWRAMLTSALDQVAADMDTEVVPASSRVTPSCTSRLRW